MLFLGIRCRLRLVEARSVILVLKDAVDSLDEVGGLRDGSRRLRGLVMVAALATLIEHVELAPSHAIQALPWLIGAAHHAAKLEAIRAVRGSRTLTTCLLLTDAVAEERDAGRDGLVWIVLPDDGKLPSILLISEWRLVFVCGAVDVVVDWILDPTETEPAVEHCSAVLFVALAEARILVELREDLVQGRYRMVALQMLQLLLNRPAG